MERNTYLESVREMLDQGNTKEAVAGLLNIITTLSEKVDTLNTQLEVLFECLNEDEDDFPFGEETDSYVVTCANCGCMLEIGCDLIDDEDAELSCPECGAVLEI